MTKNNTVEKIDNIITKIEENHSKKLSQDEAQDLLVNIEKDLTEVKKGAEGKHKEVVDEKVKELKAKIDETLEEEEGWGVIKRLLDKDIKKELVELKDKLTELEIPIPIIVTESKANDEMINFYKSEMKKLEEKAEKLEKERDEYRNKLEDKEKEVIKLTYEGKNKKNFNERVVKDAYAYIKDGAETGAEIGSKVFPVIGPVIGGYSGVGIATFGAMVNAGADTLEQGKEVYEETLNVGAKLAEKAGDNVTDVTKNISDNVTDVTKEITKEIGETLRNAGDNATKLAEVAAKYADTTKHLLGDLTDTSIHAAVDTVENFRKGGENLIAKSMDNTTSIINESIGVAKDVVNKGIGLEYKGFVVGAGMGRGNVLEATVEGKDEIIKHLEEELGKAQRAIEKKDERIKELEQLQVSQAAKQQEDQKFLFAKALETMVEVTAKSAGNSRAPSPTPPPYSKQ